MMLAFLLVGILVSAYNVRPVRAQFYAAVTINSDGSISPYSAPISTVDNITYTLTGNINCPFQGDGLDVERSNIVVDGNGYTILGNQSSGDGIILVNVNNTTVKNMKIEGFEANGIQDCGYVKLTDQSTQSFSSNDTIIDNCVTATEGAGIDVSFVTDSTVDGNNVTGGGIGLGECSNSIVSGNTVSTTSGVGISLFNSSSNTVSLNNATENEYGIQLESSSNSNTINGNNVSANCIGMYIWDSSDNVVSDNNVNANHFMNVTMPDNTTVEGFGYGINLLGSDGNIIDDNNVMANEIGIVLEHSGACGACNNTIHHNNFIGNKVQTLIDESCVGNAWDDGYANGGNYWSDGIADKPYVIDANNTDYYPLTVPIAVVPEFPSFLILPLFLIATLLAVIIYKKKAMQYKRL
jgi:parallel beta-helix repeat protein